MLTYRQPFKGEYPITQRYGETITDPKGHTGIDYACPLRTTILASETGSVAFAGWDNTGFGNCVIIQHADGQATLYAHLSLISVSLGYRVRQGEKIGESGNTGNSTGPHLHFEARHIWNDQKSHFDPMTLPLHSMVDSVNTLKEADAFRRGDTLSVVAPAGAKAFNEDFSRYDVMKKGAEVLYSGETTKRNGYTYCRCYIDCWIAVHDEDTQILDNTE